MAGWISKVIGGGVSEVLDSAGNLADKFIQTKEERDQFRLELVKVDQAARDELERTIREELRSRERVLIAELQQDDLYTRRARPTVVYAGLVFIALDYVILPVVSSVAGIVLPTLVLPTEFWAGWSGIVGTWVLGRSLEKRGANNGLVRAITGGKASTLEGDHP